MSIYVSICNITIVPYKQELIWYTSFAFEILSHPIKSAHKFYFCKAFEYPGKLFELCFKAHNTVYNKKIKVKRKEWEIFLTQRKTIIARMIS